jgi:hypothetical protein
MWAGPKACRKPRCSSKHNFKLVKDFNWATNSSKIAIFAAIFFELLMSPQFLK